MSLFAASSCERAFSALRYSKGWRLHRLGQAEEHQIPASAIPAIQLAHAD
jgi:hypothetical protein